MATSFQPNVHYNFGSPMSPTSIVDSRRVSGILESDNVSSRVFNSVTSRRGSRKLSAEPSNLADVVSSLRRRNSQQMDSLISNKLVNATHSTLGDWIRAERMSKLPPEGSSYDRVLVWASLFVDRLHSFDLAVEEFAGDSHLAAQLVYGYCMLLLELGEENSSALMVMFGFFCNCSQELVNLLDRAELFSVSQDIKDQLILALADLVTLVVCVATQFHKSLRGIATESVSIDIYNSFAGPIESFRGRCEHVSGLMWRHQLIRDGFDEATVSEIQTIKRWLEPEDPVLASVTQNAAHLAQDREELTCLWMTPYLTRFLKSNKRTLAISGKPGSGKTILSSVMIDHLQYPIGGVSYKPIFVPINSRVRAKTTPRGIVKTILSQIFDKRIGNVQLYQILADTYKSCSQTVDPEEYDNHLWSALESTLQASMRGAKELVLVVDGMDEASCGESALVQKLKQSTVNADHLKLVLLGAQKSTTTTDQTAVNITPELIFDDIAAVVRHILQSERSFTDMSEEQREMTVNRITEAADGSFLWAKLASKQVRGDGSAGPQALAKSVDSLVKVGRTIKDFVSLALQNKTVGVEAKRILSWLTVSSRPLSVREIPALLSIQLDKGTVNPQDIEPRSILRPVSSLVFFQNGLVYLRHAQVRDAIIDIFSQGKIEPATKERNVDMAQRLLLYTKNSITTENEASLTPLDPNITEGLLDKFPLLDFALRYWVDFAIHAFGCSTDQDMVTAVKQLQNYMPTSSTVPLLTMSIWQRKATPVQVLMHTIQTQFYQQILSQKHPTTLQSVLCETLLYRRLHDTMTSKVTWVLYDAVKLCNDILGPRSVVTLHVAQYFLEMTADEVTETRTEIMMKRVQVLQVLVECYKMHYGEKSEMVISIITQLAEHYHIIQEEDKSRELYTLIQDSTETQTQWTSSRKNDDSLRVSLHGRQGKDIPDLSTILSLDENEEDELISATVESNDTLLTLAETYVSQGKVELAESAYIEVWQRTSQEYRMNRSTDLELKNLQAVLSYARFLQSQKRDDEAASLLTSLWQEYDQTAISSQTVASQFAEVAKMMKSVGLSTTALNVFKHCGQYYESTSGHHSASYKEIQESIQITSKEVMQLATTSSSSVTESSLKDMVLDSVNNMDATSISAANTLIEMYISQHRWHDATSLIKTVLRGIWPQLFATSVQDVSLPSKHLDYSISLSERLSECYHARRRLSKEEDIRHRLYFALRRDRPVGDKTRDRATNSLLRLYQRTSQTDKIIHLHQEMLSDYTTQYGAEHPSVIKKLWTLAELTSPRPISVEYYRQIVSLVNKGSDICKPEAFEPLLIVATDLWNKERYTDALQPCRVLFNSLKDPKISPKLRQQDFVRMVFNRYMQCLRVARVDSAILHDVAVQYRSTCKTLFGESASITVQSTLTLANICQETTQFESEAVQLYESLLSIQSDEIDHDDIRGSLEAINDKQTDIISSDKTESLSTEQLQRVISHRSQRLTTMRTSYGWAHEESLAEMQEMASLYSRRGEFVAVASMLKDATVEVLSKETSSTRLTAAAKSIAASFITSGQVQRGRELTHEIYRQVVVKDTSNVKSVHFNVSSSQRQSLMFLAQLEYSLREDSSVTLNEIFSSLITEYIYFEHFRSAVRSKSTTVQSVTTHASRLYGFLLARGRRDTVSFVVDQFAEFILTAEGDRLQLSTASQVREFALTLLNYFTVHNSPNFLRSVAIASCNRVRQHMFNREYKTACDLALTSFKFIRAHDGYSQLPTLKLAFKLGMAVSGREQKTRPESSSHRSSMLEISSTIMKETVRLFKRMKIDLTSLGQDNLNNLIGLLDEQQDYQSLAWVLTTLWDRREAPGTNQPYFIITLARMLIITRYLVGDYTAAMRLAEDIVYNCCRVHGTRHPNTFDMTVLLSQLYTSVAQRYQSQADGREMAVRYYKKAAALHENGLRAFVDPSSVEIEYGTESGMESDDGSSTPSSALEDEGKHVRQHLHLLKHAVERLGGWPKEYAEYQRLSDEVFRAYPHDLEGVDGVEKWNLKEFGSGKAESTDDLVSRGGVQQGISFNVRDLGGLAIAV